MQSATTSVTAGRLAPSHLIGGVGGLVFAASVIIQNLLRASSMPDNDASVAKIVSFYSDHRSMILVVAALFPLGAAGLFTFAGAMYVRLASPAVRAAAFAGLVGLIGVVAMFSMTLATDLGLAGYVHGGGSNPDVVSALWNGHTAVFGVLGVSLGLALAGLSAAAATDGLIGRFWKPIGTLGGIALLISGGATPAIMGGSGLMFVGLVGFVVWLAFVIVASVALLRSTETV